MLRSWLVRSAMDDHQGVLRGVVSLSLVFFGVGGDLAALLVEPPSEEAPESLRFMALSARGGVRGGGPLGTRAAGRWRQWGRPGTR